MERSNTTINKQEDVVRLLIQRTEDIEQVIQQRRQQINELENELNKLDESVINSKSNKLILEKCISIFIFSSVLKFRYGLFVKLKDFFFKYTFAHITFICL